MKKETSISEVMKQLKGVALDPNEHRAILRKCSEEFLEHMAEVISMKPAYSFWRKPMRGLKKYYLDMLTRVYREKLPTEQLKEDVEKRLAWVAQKEHLTDWSDYLRGVQG